MELKSDIIGSDPPAIHTTLISYGVPNDETLVSKELVSNKLLVGMNVCLIS